MKRIAMLRHGRTETNGKNIYCGATDLPLSEEGREELAQLRALGGYPDASRFLVCTSGMVRTEETLRILYGETEHLIVPDLREMDFGRFEMCPYDSLKDDPLYQAWCEGDNEANPTPGGESGRDMQRRVLAAFESLVSREEDLLLVIHGGPLSFIMERLFPEEGKNRYQWQPKNGKGYMVELDGAEKRWYPVPQGGNENV